MKVRAIKCNKCGDTIFSRTRHDMRWCTCKGVAVDGGRDYVKVNHQVGADYNNVEIEIEQSSAQLFNDWNGGEELYGLIKEQ